MSSKGQPGHLNAREVIRMTEKEKLGYLIAREFISNMADEEFDAGVNVAIEEATERDLKVADESVDWHEATDEHRDTFRIVAALIMALKKSES